MPHTCFLESDFRLKKRAHRIYIALTLILAIIVIGGCVSTTKSPVSEAKKNSLWQQQLLRNANLSAWTLKGKIGVNAGEGNKGGSATLKWSYQNDRQDIELYGPFGGGRVQISVTSDAAILKDTKGVVIEGLTASQVLYQRLGWRVPFSELMKWCRGLPDDDATDLVIDDYGRLKSFNQGIWHVEYQAYRSVGDLILPRKFTIISLPGSVEVYDDGKHIGDTLRVKLIFKRWSNITFLTH